MCDVRVQQFYSMRNIAKMGSIISLQGVCLSQEKLYLIQTTSGHNFVVVGQFAEQFADRRSLSKVERGAASTEQLVAEIWTVEMRHGVSREGGRVGETLRPAG